MSDEPFFLPGAEGSDACLLVHGSTGMSWDAAENIIPEQTETARLAKSKKRMFYRKGIFCPHVNDSICCSYGYSRYYHALNNCVRIAFEQTSVHICARISFIGVTYYEFFPGTVSSLACEFPFSACWKTCTTSAA